jgi:hypothetical protein
MCFVGQPAEGMGLTVSAEGGAKSHNPRERAQPRAELRLDQGLGVSLAAGSAGAGALV